MEAVEPETNSSRSKPLVFDPWQIKGSKSLQNPERHQILILNSLAHDQHFLKIPLKSVYSFSSFFPNRQTDKCQLSHNLPGEVTETH